MAEEMTRDRAREVVAATAWRGAVWRTIERLRTAGRVLAAEVDELREENQVLRHIERGEVWYWQGRHKMEVHIIRTINR